METNIFISLYDLYDFISSSLILRISGHRVHTVSSDILRLLREEILHDGRIKKNNLFVIPLTFFQTFFFCLLKNISFQTKKSRV